MAEGKWEKQKQDDEDDYGPFWWFDLMGHTATILEKKDKTFEVTISVGERLLPEKKVGGLSSLRAAKVQAIGMLATMFSGAVEQLLKSTKDLEASIEKSVKKS